ncbi:hypothetical protein KIH23_00580 [Flavobacterium sp. CYK-55]|uniref:hypothetical protein n=1 Tax=Flavobacterium sp. CYK-55 TaxID=2835529 RepID=UPI001BCB53C4|nr:hypothetical protein [Flavobacterium sp. CYK-55]MBS7785777.1 hypothetical protein [Flavobacterium sp. CYK-55]
MEIFASSQNFEKFGIDQQEWEIENENYIINIDPPSPKIGYTLYTIMLVDSDFDNPPSWLKTNSDFIDYTLSSENIENQHLIRDHQINAAIDNLISEGASINITGANLISQNCSFDNKSYQEYMSFAIDGNSLSIDIVSNFERGINCFSYPLFWAIKNNNNEKNIQNCIFNFVQIAIDGNVTVAFKLNFQGGNAKYYDFTNHPM